MFGRVRKENNYSGKNERFPKKPPGFLSRVFFMWTMKLYWYGMFRDLDECDLVPALKAYASRLVGDKLERKWLEEQETAGKANRKPSFVKAIFKAFAFSYIPGGVMLMLYVGLETASPILFSELLTYWSEGNNAISRTTAIYYAVGMILCNWSAKFFQYHGVFFCQQFGMKLRVACSSLIFRKIMRMNNNSLNDAATGKVVNILSNDLHRFDLSCTFLHYVWILPLQLVLVCYLGYMHAGIAAIIGLIALLIISLPLQSTLARLNGKLRSKIAEKTDARIKVMNEVINGIQVIKMYAWELPFEKVVDEKRKHELHQVRRATLIRAIIIGFVVFTERSALFITILAYILLGNNLSANIIYPLQQFLSAIQLNIVVIVPLTMTFVAELVVTFQRMQEFLILEERGDLVSSLKDSMNTGHKSNIINSVSKEHNGVEQYKETSDQAKYDISVEICDVSASWTGDPNILALKNISLCIRKEKLCAVIGAVGSGKSSFLQLLLKELPAASGSISIRGKVSYASQEAWLFPKSVRENILFGLPYESEKYKTVCRVCALEKDFKQFPYGDQTLVGERGVSLSGGQRARINLARAVYREADIYLLDDPLSAVDANVGRQLFEECINGYLRGRTRILVTHQIHFLKAADFIVVLNEGSVQNMGTFNELASNGKKFSTLLASLDGDKETRGSNSLTGYNELENNIRKSRTISNETEDNKEHDPQKVAAEHRQSGDISLSVIKGYFTSGAHWTFVLFVMFMIMSSPLIGGAADYWVSYWSNQIEFYEKIQSNNSTGFKFYERVGYYTNVEYVGVHSLLVLLCIAITVIRVVPFVQMCISSSDNLHNKMVGSMLRGTMRFFDTSSSGRILNRFTKDMGSLDEILPRTIFDMVQIAITFFTVLILNAIALYWSIIPTVIVVIIIAILIKMYMKTAQAVKRLEGTTKSPVFGIISSSINGIATIRSTKSENTLIEEFDKLQDIHTSAWNSFLSGSAMLAICLDTFCIVYLAVIIFSLMYLDLDGIVGLGSVGLAVSQTNKLNASLHHGVRTIVEFIAQMTAVERVLEYTNIQTEDNLSQGKIATPSSWPSEGRIEFRNVNLWYTIKEKAVLKDLNFVIESGWKVGIVGRTGAGKSSLISALFRFTYTEGTMTIDNIDTSLLSKQDLRSKISIIPQEPVLFSATIRYNLDPFNLYTDDEIWSALEQVDMKSVISSLDFKVTEGGSNFSVGQRQLLCLARAVLRSNKILILDEATANVDPQTDNFIQQTIRRQFGECTVLTIAHRLNTIMDNDRVLVMDGGRVAEFDHPYLLLSDHNSLLSAMVQETGDTNGSLLYRVAKEAYFKKTKKNLKEDAT